MSRPRLLDLFCGAGGAAMGTSSSNDWWITTGPLPGGTKILGPFITYELALAVRTFMEKANSPETYWVDEEPA